jgi:Family of unknown function (DUF6064)
MNLPFTVEQFLGIFEEYNRAVWPMQVILVIIAVVALILSLKKTGYGDKIIIALLAFFWLWIGVVYQWIYFTAINKAAYLFGALFVLQAFVFFYAGVMKSRVSFRVKPNGYSLTGGIFILYALLIYPLLGHLFGHVYPRNPTFGLPCPTTIFTFGLLLMTHKFIPGYLLVIPLIWALIGSAAALSLTIREDFGLFIAGILGTALIFIRNKKLVTV